MKLKNKEKKYENLNDDLMFKKHKIDNEVKKNPEIFSVFESNEEKILETGDIIEKISTSLNDIPKDKNKSENQVNENSKFSAEDIDNNLMEIYSDNGKLPDFTTIKIKRKRSPILSFFYFLLFFSFIFIISYVAFNYFKNNRDISSVLELTVSAPAKVSLGEEFFYEINYKNLSNYTLNNINLNITYPENFILLEVYSIDKNENNKKWKIDSLGAKIGGKIKIRGKIINKEGANNLLSVKSDYEISGLSSSFNKDAFGSVSVGSLPFKVNNDYFSTILVGEEYPLKLSLKDFPFDKIDNFVVSFSGPENIFSIKNIENKNISSSDLLIEKINENNFKISSSSSDIIDLDFKYKISEKLNDQEKFSWSLKYIDENGKEFVFFEKEENIEIIKSDLHLSLSINDSSSDFPVNFGDKLNYVIKYANKGDKSMKDLVIMVILDSNFLNWNSLKDLNNGKVSRKTVSWTFKEISNLKELNPGQEGEIKFSIDVADFKKIEFGQNLEIKNYAQFSIGNISDFQEESERLSDNYSNTIINKINSDLSFKEEVLYFNEDNIPVGSGPLPPVVGEKTSFKYYWTLKNSLHELRDIKIELPLPAYIIWENNFNINAGNINFDPTNNKVIWTLSRWPLGIDKINIDFDVSIIPTEAEYNKIIILSSGSNLEAIDVETNSMINKRTEVKTSKLEDDNIAILNNDGRVR